MTRAELARGHATGAPQAVHLSQVVEHGLRHLAWLVTEDQEIHEALALWAGALGDYAPEPFRAFGHERLEGLGRVTGWRSPISGVATSPTPN